MTQSIVGNLRIVGQMEGSRLQAGFEASRRQVRRFSRDTRRDLDRTSASVERLRRTGSRPLFAGGFVAASRSLQTMNQRAEFLQTSMLALTAIFGGFSAAIAGNALMRYADSFTEIQNRIRVVTDSMGELTAVQNSLFDIAQESRTSFRDNVVLYGRLAVASKRLGTSQKDLLRITETIQKAFLVGGSTTQEASASAIQLSQGIASNRLGGDELRSVLENQALGQLLANQISDGDIGQFRKMAREGKLTADVLMDAFLNASGQIDKAFSELPPTISQSFVILDNALMQYFGSADQSIGVSQAFAKAVIDLADSLDVVIPVLGAVGAGFIAAFAGPRIAAITANTAATIKNMQAQAANSQAAVAHARAAVQSAAAQRANALAQLEAARANVTNTRALVGSTASQAALTRALKARFVAQQQVLASSRALTAANAQMTASAAVATTMIGRLGSGLLAIAGGPVGVGIMAVAGALYLLSQHQTDAEKTAEAHEEALNDLDGQIALSRGQTEEYVKELRKQIAAQIDAAESAIALAKAEQTRLAAYRSSIDETTEMGAFEGAQFTPQGLEEALGLLNDEISATEEHIEALKGRLTTLDDEVSFTPPGSVDQDALEKAKKLAERLEDLRIKAESADLSELDKQVVQTAQSFDIGRAAIEQYMEAARSGDFSNVAEPLMQIRGALAEMEAYKTAAQVIESLHTPLEKAARYQEQLNRAVERGALTVHQAQQAYREYVDGLDFGTIDDLSDAFSDATKSMIKDTENIGDAIERLADRILDIAWQELIDPIFRDTFRGTGGGGSGGGLLGGLTSAFSGLAGLFGFGGFFADGGTLGAGKWGIAGEGGMPEVIHGPANITPIDDLMSSGGPTIVNHNDFSNTDPSQRAWLTQQLNQRDANIMAQVGPLAQKHRGMRPQGI